MSISARIPAVAFILAALAVSAFDGALAFENEEFIEWARSRSSELDSKWNRMTGTYNLSRVNARRCLRGRVRAGRTMPVRAAAFERGGDRSRVNPSFTGRPGSADFLPRSSRSRSGPTRGTSTFSHPARGNHGIGYDRLRPANSSIQRTSHFAPRGSVSRPRLSRFGRISGSRSRSRGGSYGRRSATRSRRRR